MAVPARKYTHFTPKKRAQFLATLAECGNVTAAARAVGISREDAYHVRRGDSAFAAAWEEAANLGANAMEDEARRRAFAGVEEPVVSAKGLVYGNDGQPLMVRKYSDTLLIFLLKGAKPERYRENSKVEHQGGVTVRVEHSSDWRGMKRLREGGGDGGVPDGD